MAIKPLKDLTSEEREHYDAIKAFKPKARQFILLQKGSPVTWSIPNRHKHTKPLQWFDYQKEVPRSLRYCTNQSSPFIDEQEGDVVLGDIVFNNGVLNVPAHDVALQKLLLFYHPDIGRVFEEFNPEKKAQEQLSTLQAEIKAQNSVIDMDITDLEAVARVAIGSKVDNMMSDSIRRDMLIWAKQNPREFERLANDSDIQMRNLAQRAVDFGIVGIRDSGTTVYFTDTDEIIIKVPFGESAILNLAKYMQTDEGLKIMDRIAMKLQE